MFILGLLLGSTVIDNLLPGWGLGGIRLIVGFQTLMVIPPTASWIRWCMRGDLMWTCLVWAARSTPDNFGAKPPIQFRHR